MRKMKFNNMNRNNIQIQYLQVLVKLVNKTLSSLKPRIIINLIKKFKVKLEMKILIVILIKMIV